jgi:RNA polymerase sigma-70 factor (ECF subfamily)
MGTGERDVLLLYALTELSYSAVAGVLDIPVGTVRSRLSRARGRLIEVLTDPPPPDEIGRRR